VLWHWKLRHRNVTCRVFAKELIDEIIWRAARNGSDGKLVEFGKQEEFPGGSLLREWCNWSPSRAPKKRSPQSNRFSPTAPAPTTSCSFTTYQVA